MRAYTTGIKLEIYSNNSSEAIMYTENICEYLNKHTDVKAEYVNIECHGKGD